MRSPLDSHIVIGPNINAVNLCNYQGCGGAFNMGVCDESFKNDPSIAGGTRITDFLQFAEVPGLIAQLEYQVVGEVGTCLLNVPVNPYLTCIDYNEAHSTDVGVPGADSNRRLGTTPLGSIASQYCYWRGDLIFYVHAFPTKYHAGRLLISFIPGSDDQTFKSFTLKQLTSCNCAIMDITGLCSTFVFRVPWCADCPYRINKHSHRNSDFSAPGYDMSIGRLQIHIWNKLTAPHNVEQQVHVNVYLAGAQMEFYAPIFSIGIKSELKANAGEDDEKKPEVVSQVTDSGFDSTGYAQQHNPQAVPKALGRTEEGIPTAVMSSLEDPVLAQQKPQTFPELPPGHPRHSASHTNIYNYMGRAHYYETMEFFNYTAFCMPIA